jgi:DNA-binding NarL/FixJ family response regulator
MPTSIYTSDPQVQSESRIMMNLDQVTPREQQILNLLVQGFSNKEIGGELNISLRTVGSAFVPCFCVPESARAANV